MPGDGVLQELLGELADALEAVSKESDDADEGVNDNDDVGELRAAPFPEARLNPLRPGHGVGPAEPTGEEDHQENLVEGGPKPGNPHALETIDEHPVHQQHGSADIEHAGGVRDAEDVPRHGV